MSRVLERATEEAIRAYELWHQKEVDEIIETSYPLERTDVFWAGHADVIYYTSDKWEQDGDVYRYVHDFDSRPGVFTKDGYEDSDDDTIVDPCWLLHVPEVSARAKAPLAFLATVEELIFVRPDGSKHSYRFRSPPALLGTTDRKGLLILSRDKGPIYIRGGKMFYDERGIHR